MSLINRETTVMMTIPARDELLRICKLFDNTQERFRCFKHYQEFCNTLYEHEKSIDEDSCGSDDTVDLAVNAALKINNYEYKIKILKVLMVYWNKIKINNRESYDQIKEQILSILPSASSSSIFKISESFIASECNKSYFELCFLLKQNQLKKFEFEFEILVEKYKRFYGDYFKYAMRKDCGIYLKEVAENRKYYKTTEFISHKCPFIELNSNIKTEFEEILNLIYTFGERIKKEDKDFLIKWRENIRDFSPPEDKSEEDEFREIFNRSFEDNDMTEKRLFGRITEDETSLLEEMLMCPYTNFIFKCAWNRFRLWTKPEIFLYINPSGKTLIDYAIESGEEEQLNFLLMPKNESEASLDKKKHFMIMKNNQVYNKTGKCIIEHFLENLTDTDNDALFKHFVYLLEEIGYQTHLKNDELIDKLINLSQSDDFFEQITGLMPDGTDDMARKLFNIEDILGNMIVYWSADGDVFKNYKMRLENVSPFYKLMFLIIERKSDEFCQNFREILTKMEESFETRYKNPEGSEKYSSNLLFIMLNAAIKTKQRSIIDFIFNNDTFSTIFFEFPSNIVAEEIHYYTALKFLKYKHGIGRGKIPKDWMTAEVLEEFFDSQITFNNEELIEIDCNSLIHEENQKKLFNVELNITDKHIMHDDTDSLEYIITHENLKELITHPVIETYINLKSLKYQRIFTWNFWAFVIFFIIPFTMLIMHNNTILLRDVEDMSENDANETTMPPNSSESLRVFNEIIQSFLSATKYVHFIGIIFLFLRESFQFFLSETWKKYFRKMSNLFEIALLLLSISLSVATFFENKICIKVFEVGFILVTTISATSILPFAHVPNNMQILKKVAMTFLRIFYTFAIILIAFSFSFCIMFQDLAKQGDNDDDPFENFKYPHHALVKIITMLSGEYEIQPATLNFMSLLFFCVFIISSFILFNLILGLSIEDVAELKKSSRAFDLKTKSARFIEVSKKVEEYYLQHYRDHKQRKLENDAQILPGLAFKLIRFFLSKYIYLHTITKIEVNVKTKQVFVKANHKKISILKSVDRLAMNKNYYISEETFKDIKSIVNEKKRKIFKQLKKKIEHEQAAE